MRKITLPSGKGWIGLPDVWLGKHAAKRDVAYEAAKTKNLPSIFLQFAVAMAMLEDWGDIQGLDGNPEAWNFEELEWTVMAFIIGYVSGDFENAKQVSKNS